MKVKNTIYKNRFILISFFSTAFLWFIIYLISQIGIGENTILRMDLYHQYCPLFAEMYDKIVSGDFSSYSFESGLGSSFIGNYFNYLSSPIAFIVVLFGHKHVPEAIAAMILIKGALSSACFAYYLKKSQHRHSISTIAFSVLYSFCGYMLAYYWNVMWLDAMVLLPIVLLGIEKIIDNGKIWLFTGSLALTMFSNYYMSYMICIFSVIYFLYYFALNYSLTSSLYCGEKEALNFRKKIKSNRFLKSGFRFAGAAMLSAGLMAVCLIPTYTILQACSATSSSFPSEMSSYFNFFDFFANHLACLETTIRSSGDDVLPNVYCGMVTIVLAPLYFFTKTISKKEKIATLILLGIFFISFNTNYLNYIWHGMHFPNDLPYRFSFIYSFILCLISYKTFIRLNEFTSRQIGLAGAAVLAMIFIITKVESKNVDSKTIYISLIFAVIYVVVLALFKNSEYLKSTAALILCVFVSCEVIISDTQAIKNTVTKDSYESDYEEFREIKTTLDTIESGDTSYRMELTDLRTRMDGPWFGYNSVSVFSSMAYENAAMLENRLGEMSNGINSYTYNPQTPVFNMMHSLKYIVNNSDPNILYKKYYSSVASSGKYTAYKNNYYLPIAYCVKDDILDWDTQFDISQHHVNPFYVQGLYFDLATGAGDPFKKIDFNYISYNNVNAFTEPLTDNTFNYTKTNYDTDASATFYLLTPTKGNVYVFYNIDGASDENVTFNSNDLTVSRACSQDQIVDLGHFDKGTTITINIPFESNTGGLRLYAYTIDDKKLDKGYEKLSNNVLNVESFKNNEIKGTVSNRNDSILYTSIPYDKGWSVFVDGEKVTGDDYLEIGGALLGIRLSKGNHEVRFKYEVQNSKIGFFLSSVSLFVLLLIILISRIPRKKAKYYSFNPVNNCYTELDLRPIVDQNTVQKEKVKTKEKETFVPASFNKEIIMPPKGIIKREIISPRSIKKNSLGEELVESFNYIIDDQEETENDFSKSDSNSGND